MRHIFTIVGLLGLAIAQDPTVTISDGPIVGTTTVLPTATVKVNKFLSIPFGAKPVRFSPPQSPARWTTPLRVQQWGPACWQDFSYPPRSHERAIAVYGTFGNRFPLPAENEDCLTLSVYARAAQAPAGGRAVLVWFLGGNLQFGNAGQIIYDGTPFATYEDVIVVVPNYRTNFFGYLASPELPAGQKNLGFLDQRKALEWVQANIKFFGGDPKRVTIFGVSSGGNSVKQLVATPPKPITFSSAIIQSEANGYPPGSQILAYNGLLDETGCRNAPSQVECLRQVDAFQIRSYAENSTAFFPPDNDGVTASSDIRVQAFTGRAAKVPVMVGTTTEEGRGIAYVLGYTSGNLTVAGALDALRNTLALVGFNTPGLADGLIGNATSGMPGIDGFTLFSNILTDLLFKCTASGLIDVLRQSGNQNVWRYLYTPNFPNIGNDFKDAGVFHACDTSSIFGTYPVEGSTAQQRALSRYQIKVWSDFAKNPYKGPGWPKIGSNFGNEMFAFGRDGSNTGKLERQALYDLNCPLFAPFVPVFGY